MNQSLSIANLSHMNIISLHVGQHAIILTEECTLKGRLRNIGSYCQTDPCWGLCVVSLGLEKGVQTWTWKKVSALKYNSMPPYPEGSCAPSQRWYTMFSISKVVYSAVPLYRCQFSPKFSKKTHHSSPVRARHGVSFVSSTTSLYFALVTAVMYAICC